MTEVTQTSEPSSTPETPGKDPTAARALQPLLHDLASMVAAPALLLSDPDGQVREGGVSGWYAGDVRLLDVLEVAVEGSGLDLVGSDVRAAAEHRFSHVARGLGDAMPDPTVRVDVLRTLGADGDGSVLEQRVVVSSAADVTVDVVLHVTLRADLAPMAVVKQGGRGGAVGLEPGAEADLARWSGTGGSATLRASSSHADPDVDLAAGRLTWRARLERGERLEAGLRARAEVEAPFAPGRPAPWSVRVRSDDVRLRRLVDQGLTDLEGLLLADRGGDGDDRFLAAGSPWFLTLFGRDSLWAARMLVPLDAGLALSTLRTLARRQGTRHDPATEEEPGKILHEVRPGTLDLGEQVLPPVYYGTVDATPLFVCTLADAADWGADPAQVRALLPAARAALEWVLAAAGETGWLRYLDHSGHGLSNQGWKDSHDSVQFADGTLAEPPIALSEVQAYAHEAAVRGAALLEAHGEPPVPGLADWAAGLRERFAASYWVETADGGHPAIALDGGGRRADSLTSNLGHLLGTGVLPADRARRVGDLLVDPRLDSGYGLRTLAGDSPRFSRSSYHGGTVWPHDTAVAVRGLAAEGRHDDAARLAAGVVAASEGFAYRLPELYGGDAIADAGAGPTAYPAACRPQAWAAAAPLAMLVAVAGLRADVPAGVLHHPRRTTTRLGAWSLHGLRAGPAVLDLHVAADGAVTVDLPPRSRLRVEVHG